MIERHVVDMFVAVSQATIAGNGLADGSWPHRVIPNFLPPVNGASYDDLASHVAQLPKTDYLLFVGDLRHAKGLDVLLRAYGDLESAAPLVLIGKIWPETPQSLPPNVMVFKNWPNTAVMELVSGDAGDRALYLARAVRDRRDRGDERWVPGRRLAHRGDSGDRHRGGRSAGRRQIRMRYATPSLACWGTKT